MNELPKLVQRAPHIFYGAAFIAFFFTIWATWTDVSANYAYAEAEHPVARMIMIRAVYQAATEALYLAGTGVLAHILLAILNRLPKAANTAGADQ